QRFSIKSEWMIKPWEIETNYQSGIRTFIFVDDFLGTGIQFEEVLQDANIDQKIMSTSYIAYFPLVAHKTGVKYLKGKYAALRVRAVENLDSSYNVFGPSSTCFEDKINTPDLAQEFYFDFLKRKRIAIANNLRCGFGEL